MTKVDQFESLFRAAEREPFRYEPPAIERILVVTDLDDYGREQMEGAMRTFLSALGDTVAWISLSGTEFRSVQDLLDLVESARPDLICTYRHLHSDGWKHRFTLGDHTEVLTQATATPVLVVPHPKRRDDVPDGVMDDTRSVMAITDHLAGDHRLVSWAARLTTTGGTLRLTHVEDDAVFERYLDTIGRIPDIDTETARETILTQLLKAPADFVASCRTELAARGVDIQIEKIVRLGHHLRDHAELVAAQDVDLLVFHANDSDQTAMHGLAYPLAVQLTTTPLLMI